MKKPEIWDPYADFQKTILPNGLGVYSSYWNRPWMHVRICVHSGSLADPAGKEGLAHFVEHMISNRSGELGFMKLKRMINNSGGSANFGVTGPYRSSFNFEVPILGTNLDKMLDVFGKILLYDLEMKYLEKERKIIENEFRESYPTKQKFEIEIMRYAQAYQGTRFQKFTSTLGSLQTIKAMTENDLQNFFSEHYAPSNISVIATGGLAHEDFVNKVNSTIFSLSRVGRVNKIPDILKEIPYPKENEQVINFSELFPGLQIDVSALDAYSMIPGTFNRKAVSMLRSALRDTLFRKIREKTGATYNPRVNWEFHGNAYEMHVGLLLEKSELMKVKDSILWESLDVARKKNCFLDQQRFFIRSYLVDDMNIKDLCEEVENDLVKFGFIICAVKEIELLQKVTYEEYENVIDYLLEKRRWCTMISLT